MGMWSLIKNLFGFDQEVLPEERELGVERAREKLTREIISEEKTEISTVNNVIGDLDTLWSMFQKIKDPVYQTIVQSFSNELNLLMQNLGKLRDQKISVTDRDVLLRNISTSWSQFVTRSGRQYSSFFNIVVQVGQKAGDLVNKISANLKALGAELAVEKETRATRAALEGRR